MKKTLTVNTPVGPFTRTTETAYTHVVVRTSERAKRVADAVACGEHALGRGGVDVRWVKDRGHAVTWHKSAASAEKAAAQPYAYDHATVVVGIFAVET